MRELSADKPWYVRRAPPPLTPAPSADNEQRDRRSRSRRVRALLTCWTGERVYFRWTARVERTERRAFGGGTPRRRLSLPRTCGRHQRRQRRRRNDDETTTRRHASPRNRCLPARALLRIRADAAPCPNVLWKSQTSRALGYLSRRWSPNSRLYRHGQNWKHLFPWASARAFDSEREAHGRPTVAKPSADIAKNLKFGGFRKCTIQPPFLGVSSCMLRKPQATQAAQADFEARSYCVYE